MNPKKKKSGKSAEEQLGDPDPDVARGLKNLPDKSSYKPNFMEEVVAKTAREAQSTISPLRKAGKLFNLPGNVVRFTATFSTILFYILLLHDLLTFVEEIFTIGSRMAKSTAYALGFAGYLTRIYEGRKNPGNFDVKFSLPNEKLSEEFERGKSEANNYVQRMSQNLPKDSEDLFKRIYLKYATNPAEKTDTAIKRRFYEIMGHK